MFHASTQYLSENSDGETFRLRRSHQFTGIAIFSTSRVEKFIPAKQPFSTATLKPPSFCCSTVTMTPSSGYHLASTKPSISYMPSVVTVRRARTSYRMQPYVPNESIFNRMLNIKETTEYLINRSPETIETPLRTTTFSQTLSLE